MHINSQPPHIEFHMLFLDGFINLELYFYILKYYSNKFKKYSDHFYKMRGGNPMCKRRQEKINKKSLDYFFINYYLF